MTTFSDGSAVKTLTIPPGGGTISVDFILPVNSTICSAEVTVDRPSVAVAGTPYVWIPLSGTNQLSQLRTSDGAIIRVFQSGIRSCAANSFSNPSRITVIPDGDIWVANRDNGTVTRLGLMAECIGDDCYECKGTYADILAGSGPRGVTFDANGDVWVAAHNTDRICKYQQDGTLINCKNSGCQTYGMIGDSNGNVWISDRTNHRVCRCSGDINCMVATAPGAMSNIYGIGMDNEDDIWVAGYEDGMVYEIDHATLNVRTCSSNVGPAGGPRGIAVDGLNRVWVANCEDDHLYVIDQNCDPIASVATGYSNVIGVAINSDNSGWVVSQGSGRALKYEIVGNSLNRLLDINVGDKPYNYSDMTGFRTPKVLVKFAGDTFSPVAFPHAIDFAAPLQGAIAFCGGGVYEEGGVCGNMNCRLAFVLSSTFAGGDYELRDLKISYGDPLSKISGGLVPCGRKCDDLTTAIREDTPCAFCHIFVLIKRIVDFATTVVGLLFILMITLGGIILITSRGDPSKANQGKGILKAAIIGAAITLAAWLIVNTIVVFLTPASSLLQNWNTINCLIP